MSSRSDGPTGKSGKGSKGGKSGKGKGGKAKSAPDLHPIDYAVLDTWWTVSTPATRVLGPPGTTTVSPFGTRPPPRWT
jgi:hypothetical protein